MKKNDSFTPVNDKNHLSQLADDDYVFQWGKESWTMKTDGMGMKAGDKPSLDCIEVSKFNKDGKNSDHWTFVSFQI